MQLLKKNSLLGNQKIVAVKKPEQRTGSFKGGQPTYINFLQSVTLNVNMNDLLQNYLFLVSTFQNSKISRLTR